MSKVILTLEFDGDETLRRPATWRWALEDAETNDRIRESSWIYHRRDPAAQDGARAAVAEVRELRFTSWGLGVDRHVAR